MDDKLYMAGFTAIFAALAANFRELAAPVVILVIAMVCDYLTGMGRAWVRRELASRVGVIGIIKKVGYLVAVAVSCCVDFVVQYAAEKTGADWSGVYICGLTVTVWLILNECISILENLEGIGTPLPGFLTKLLHRLQKTAEKQGDAAAGQDEGEDG
ncbi:MAG: phage holin family protein [Oscillospiraceae bacterium]|nr:phage holin family protein [Oscillospiraceae bacterium]MBQ9412901.1 phage holin family protein [Oscillospiraceae bacterium]